MSLSCEQLCAKITRVQQAVLDQFICLMDASHKNSRPISFFNRDRHWYVWKIFCRNRLSVRHRFQQNPHWNSFDRDSFMGTVFTQTSFGFGNNVCSSMEPLPGEDIAFRDLEQNF